MCTSADLKTMHFFQEIIFQSYIAGGKWACDGSAVVDLSLVGRHISSHGMLHDTAHRLNIRDSRFAAGQVRKMKTHVWKPPKSPCESVDTKLRGMV